MSDTKRVLVAEDDSFLRETIIAALEEHDELEVIGCENGTLAIEAIEAQRPDILLLDLYMPELDGYGVLEYLQSHEHDFPVVMLSNVSDESSKQKCESMGAVGFLVKSDMDEDELWANVKPFIQ